MGVPCFWLEPAPVAQESLRRFVHGPGKCPSAHGYHDADVVLGEVPWAETTVTGRGVHADDALKADPRWPKKCAGCDYVFQPADEWQHNLHQKYRRSDTGALLVLREAPAGAMWDAHWMPDIYKGVDGRCLIVKLPGGHDWMIDGEASNCTRKGDRTHRCWIRHGEPPRITADKNGDTCAAGAGSIIAGNYHGFLRDGVLVPA